MSKKVIIVIVAVIIIIAIIVGVSISLMTDQTQEVPPVQSSQSPPLIKAPSTTTDTPAAPPSTPPPVTLSEVGRSDPCANYKDTDKNVSNECMNSLWSNAGCKPEQFPYGNTVKDWKERTLTQLKGDMDYWANGPNWTKDICHGRAPPPPKFPRVNIADEGYGDNTQGSFKRGFYDILGQGAPNDYCRYTGDGPNIKFTCQLSDGSSIFATSYNGKNVTDIITANKYTPVSYIRYYMRNNYLHY